MSASGSYQFVDELAWRIHARKCSHPDGVNACWNLPYMRELREFYRQTAKQQISDYETVDEKLRPLDG